MIRTTLIFSGCLLLGSFVFWSGCSDAARGRIDVAKKTVLEKIDDMLGKMDVQKAEIDNSIKSSKVAVDGIRKAKIRAGVQLDLLNEKVRPFEDRLAQCDASLGKVRDALTSGKPATFAGKTHSPEELKSLAGKIIEERKKAESEINGLKNARDSMTKQVALLGDTQKKFETRINNLQTQVTRLDTEIIAAKAMKEASTKLGDSGASLSENLDELDKKIATLSAEARGELANETERLNLNSSEKAINEVDSFIKDTQKQTDTVAEIDKILGKSK